MSERIIGDVCRVCGCTELYGCPGGCSWIVRAGAEILCTACIAHATDDELDASDEENEEEQDGGSADHGV